MESTSPPSHPDESPSRRPRASRRNFAIALAFVLALSMAGPAPELAAAETPPAPQSAQPTGAAAQAGRFAAYFDADPVIRAAASSQGPLALADLEDLALTASGYRPDELAAGRARIDAVLGGLGRDLAGARPADEGARAEEALSFLHARILRSYDLDATTMGDILDSGRFNCVSSAVLYLIAMRSLGIEAAGVKTTDHAFCLVRIEGREIDVETTNPYGFDPGTKKEFADRFGKTTGYSYVAPGNYSRRRTVDERELVALILANRMAQATERRDARGALSLAYGYYLLAAQGDGRKILLDCVENLAADLADRKDFASIEELARTAAAFLGQDARLSQLLETAIYDGLALVAGTADWRAAVAGADSALAEGSLGRKNHDSIVVYAYGSAANALGQKGDWLGAARLAEEGAQKAPSDRSLSQAAAGFRRNFVVTAHNRFATLYNTRDYAAAAAVLEEALKLLPGDPTLLADLEIARRAMGR